MTPAELAAILGAATPAKWRESEAVPGAIEITDPRHGTMNLFGLDVEGYAICPRRPDAAAIVTMRNVGPLLVELWKAAERTEQGLILQYDLRAYEVNFPELRKALSRLRDFGGAAT